MEHWVILGGEHLLPFARSRIKALKALGIAYASQSFEVDGASVKVSIEPGHEYLRIEGGGAFGGVTQDSEQITVGDSTFLRSFLPYASARQFCTSKDANNFSDEPLLNVMIHDSLIDAITPPAGITDPFHKFTHAFTGPIYTARTGLQTEHLAPTMYSGLMAKAVQIMLGYGINPPAGAVAQVPYDSRWLRCHGIITASDEKLWLIEISAERGVLAMPFGIVTGPSNKIVKNELGGFPSGATFPDTDVLLDAAIAAGDVLRLKTASEMTEVYYKDCFSSALGWTFGTDEAYNTCYSSATEFMHGVWHPYWVFTHLYKLKIEIGPTVPPESRAPLEPLATATATLTEVERCPISVYGLDLIDIFPVPFAFYEPLIDSMIATPAYTYGSGGPTTPPSYAYSENGAVLLACHIMGSLDLVRIGVHTLPAVDIETVTGDGLAGESKTAEFYGWTSALYISSDTHPGERNTSQTYGTYDRSVHYLKKNSDGITLDYVVYPRLDNSVHAIYTGGSACVWAEGFRDGYAMRQAETQDLRYTTYSSAATISYDTFPTYVAAVNALFEYGFVIETTGTNPFGLVGTSMTEQWFPTIGARETYRLSVAAADTNAVLAPEDQLPAEPVFSYFLGKYTPTKVIFVGSGLGGADFEYVCDFNDVPAELTDVSARGDIRHDEFGAATAEGEKELADIEVWAKPGDVYEAATTLSYRSNVFGVSGGMAFSPTLVPPGSAMRVTARNADIKPWPIRPDSIEDAEYHSYSFVGLGKIK